MNKKSIIIGAVALLLAATTAWAVDRFEEKELGSVIAVERSFSTSLEACTSSFEKIIDNKELNTRSSIIKCLVNSVPQSDEEYVISSSLDSVSNSDITELIRALSNMNTVHIRIQASAQGYEITTGEWSLDYGKKALGPITKEQFLAKAKILIDKFPKLSVKLIKVIK